MHSEKLKEFKICRQDRYRTWDRYRAPDKYRAAFQQSKYYLPCPLCGMAGKY